MRRSFFSFTVPTLTKLKYQIGTKHIVIDGFVLELFFVIMFNYLTRKIITGVSPLHGSFLSKEAAPATTR